MSTALKDVTLIKETNVQNRWTLVLIFEGEYWEQNRSVEIRFWSGRSVTSVIHDVFLFLEALTRLIIKE